MVETTRSTRLFFMCGGGVVYELNASCSRASSGIHNRLPLNISHERRETAYVVRERFVKTQLRVNFLESHSLLERFNRALPVLLGRPDFPPPAHFIYAFAPRTRGSSDGKDS